MVQMSSITILIMDDAVIIRKLIVNLLSEIQGVERIVQATDAASALKLLAEYKPEVAIYDIKIPGGEGLRNGIDVLKATKKSYPHAAVIMLTNHATARYRVECQQAGADFFFDKSSEFEQLAAAVEEIMQRTNGA